MVIFHTIKKSLDTGCNRVQLGSKAYCCDTLSSDCEQKFCDRNQLELWLYTNKVLTGRLRNTATMAADCHFNPLRIRPL